MLFYDLVFSQIPADPPTSFYALSWIALGAMAASLVYVFRQWQAEKRNCTRQHLETIDRLVALLDEKEKEVKAADLETK